MTIQLCISTIFSLHCVENTHTSMHGGDGGEGADRILCLAGIYCVFSLPSCDSGGVSGDVTNQQLSSNQQPVSRWSSSRF